MAESKKPSKPVEVEPVKEQPKPELIRVCKNGVTVTRTYEELDRYLAQGWKEVK